MQRRRGLGCSGWVAAPIALLLAASACTGSSATGSPGGTDRTSGAPATAQPLGPVAADLPPSCRGTGATTTTDLVYRDVPQVDPNLLSLDLSRPTLPVGCPPPPLVVYVHGGGFRTGDKANRIDDKVALFTGEGWAFASVNYRLTADDAEPVASGAEPVRFPIHEQDVATAIAWLVDHAGEHGIDPARILLIGHSSGAFIVSLLSTDTSFLRDAGVDPAAVRCTASLDTEYDAAAQVAQGGNQEALYRGALGDDPSTWVAASPAAHVGDPGPRPRFLVVTQGAPRRVAQAEAFADDLIAHGTPATVIDARPLDHEGINAAVGDDADAIVTPAVLALFRSCVGDPAAP